jgi:osmoprotectant transport system permease protein
MLLQDALQYALDNPELLRSAIATHLSLSALALLIAVAIALPVGVLVSARPRTALLAINTANVSRTLPSLAVLALMLPLLGTGFAPSLVALILLAIPPVLINTYIGIRQVEFGVIDAATGMGMTRFEVMTQVQLPMAVPVIFAGIRTSAVQVVAGATLAAFIGGGGLGDFITSGIAMMEMPLLLVGAVPVTAMAMATEFIFGRIQRGLTPKGMREEQK